MGDAWLADQVAAIRSHHRAEHVAAGGPCGADPCLPPAPCVAAAIRSCWRPHRESRTCSPPRCWPTSFTDAGWQVEMAFPETKKRWPTRSRRMGHDAVDIALSDALARQRALVKLRELGRGKPQGFARVIWWSSRSAGGCLPKRWQTRGLGRRRSCPAQRRRAPACGWRS